MEIKTKFNFGQEVWLLHENKITKEIVDYIEVHIIGDAGSFREEIKYHLSYDYSDLPFGDSDYKISDVKETRLFASPEELIESLTISATQIK